MSINTDEYCLCENKTFMCKQCDTITCNHNKFKCLTCSKDLCLSCKHTNNTCFNCINDYLQLEQHKTEDSDMYCFNCNTFGNFTDLYCQQCIDDANTSICDRCMCTITKK
jgi:hypothetical protein